MPTDVVDNPAANRFELVRDGHLAELVYRVRGQQLVLVHTGVPDELGGQGIGGLLVQAALERAEREGLTIVPQCPFARGWLERHPNETARVAVE